MKLLYNDPATGIGPQQTGDPHAGFSHLDSMNCAACHSSWSNSCIGCHLEGEYNEGNNFSNITGERIVFRQRFAEFVYQSPVPFFLGIGMDNKIRERRQAGDKSPELAALLKTKTKAFKLDLKPTHWHTLHITVSGNTMTVKIDDQPAGAFSSEGIAHPTKRMITLAVNKSAQVDDVKVWRTK